MIISSTVVVTRPLDEVWSFLVDLRNVPKWDRSIARATLISGETLGSADLRFKLELVDAGTRITHEIDLRVRRWLPFLSPILSVLSRRALATDLDCLRRAVDEGFDLTTVVRREP